MPPLLLGIGELAWAAVDYADAECAKSGSVGRLLYIFSAADNASPYVAKDADKKKFVEHPPLHKCLRC